MTRSRTADKPHTLVITAPGDGLEPEREWRVVHPPTCPWEAMRCPSLFLDEDNKHWLFHRACLTQYEVENVGLDGLDGWEQLPPGRYQIVCESIYYPGEYGGTYGAEWDVEMSLVAPAAVREREA